MRYLFIFQGPVQLLGIRSLKIFTRAVIGGAGSELDVSAPIWSDGVYTNRVTTGREGDDGKDGFNGPTGKTEQTYEVRGYSAVTAHI